MRRSGRVTDGQGMRATRETRKLVARMSRTKARAMYFAKCSHVKAQQTSCYGNSKWNESVGTVRCGSRK
eukprot:3032775-Pyramimonas_sp.AAC.1